MNLALRPLTAAVLTASATLAVALSACGSDTIDTDKVESTIVAQFKQQGIPLTDVTCDEVEPKVGAPVRCTALNPSKTKLFIEGKLTSRNGDKVHVEADVVRGEANGAAFAKEIEAKVEQQAGVEIEALSCPKSFAMPTTSPVRCVATVAGGDRHEITFSVDAKGKSDLEFDTEPLSSDG